MRFGKANAQHRLRRVAGLVFVSVCMVGLLESCNDLLLNATGYVDPCGTIFANCEPGDFLVNAASSPDYCIDPTCTIPGQCTADPPLGLTANICP